MAENEKNTPLSVCRVRKTPKGYNIWIPDDAFEEADNGLAVQGVESSGKK